MKDIKTFFEGSEYHTPARNIGILSRLFPSLSFYFKLISIVWGDSRKARSGNYDSAALLVEGEEADMYRVLHSDINYRIGVCGSGNLSSIQFRVLDVRDNYKLLYDNAEHDYEWKWDVTLESSRQLRIVVTVPVADENTTSPEEGCVTVMIGSTDY